MDPTQEDRNEKNSKEITEKDVISFISIKKIPLKDKEYAKKHIIIEKKSKTDRYEIKVTDVDGKVHSFHIELKTYP